jgi:hypothetical protein
MSSARVHLVAEVPEMTFFPEGEVVELALLLPAGQAAVLEAAARQRALTAAQLTRQLIRQFLDPCGGPRFPE